MRVDRIGTVAVVGLLTLAVVALGSAAVLAADDPAVTSTATEEITISVTDSANGNATTTVPVTVTNESIPEDAVYESGSTAAEYDEDGDGRIDVSELGAAGLAYANGEISVSELGNVGAAYARSG